MLPLSSNSRTVSRLHLVAERVRHSPLKKRVLSLVVIALLSSPLHSQVAYYLRPSVAQKWYANAVYAPGRSHGIFPFSGADHAPNHYCSYRNIPLSRRADVPLGICAGISFNHQKHHLEVGFSQDGVGSAVEVASFLSMGSGLSESMPHYAINRLPYTSLHRVNRWSVGYYRRIGKRAAAQKNRYFTYAELALLQGRAQQDEVKEEGGLPQTLLYNTAKKTAFHATSVYWGGVAFMLGLGLSADLGLRINRQWRYWFSLDISYRQGFRTVESTTYQTVVEEDGQSFSIDYDTTNRGSGLYVALSRKLQLPALRGRKAAKQSAASAHNRFAF